MTFKFFRQYNKFILAVGGSLLMMAFLIQPIMGMFAPGGGKIVIGRIDSQTITAQDVAIQGQQLDRIARLFRGQLPNYDPLQWMLMKREALQLQMWASDFEVSEILRQLQYDSFKLANTAHQMKISAGNIRQDIRDWAMVQLHYAPLVSGRNYNGTARLSKPVLQRYVHDWSSTVRISGVVVRSTRFLDRISEPSEQDLIDLFNRHKDDLKGEGDRYGLGYRYPDRVKIEYLDISSTSLHEKVTVSEADALEYYQDNPDQFTTRSPEVQTNESSEASAAVVVKPYKDVRHSIIRKLHNKQARELGRKMVKAAQAIILNHNRRLKQHDGYRVLQHASPSQWQPLDIQTLAKMLDKQFAILPSVIRYDDNWITRDDLTLLRGIGTSRIDGDNPSPFRDYVLSAREFEPDERNRLLTLRLQEHITSAPMIAMDDSFYLFRLIQVQPAHSPQSLEEVRRQVTDDAKRLAAYKILLDDQQNWRKRLATEKLEELTLELGTQVLTPPPFARRELNQYIAQVTVPNIAGIGRNLTIVDRIFQLNAQVQEAGGIDLTPLAKRTDVIPLDAEQSLLLVRIDAFNPAKFSLYKLLLNSPNLNLRTLITQTMRDNQSADPLSLESLKKRLGFVAEE